MHPSIRLVAMPEATNFAPLGVLGYCLMRTSFLAPVLQAVTVPLKTVAHAPAAKVLDVLVSILAGCRAITQINTQLRPDLALACAAQLRKEPLAEDALAIGRNDDASRRREAPSRTPAPIVSTRRA